MGVVAANNNNGFDLAKSEKKRFGFQMAALGAYLTGAGLILSIPIAIVAFEAVVTAVTAIGLVAGGIGALIIGGGFASAKSAEFQKQQQHATLTAGNTRAVSQEPQLAQQNQRTTAAPEQNHSTFQNKLEAERAQEVSASNQR